MTGEIITCLIKYSPYTIDVSSSVIERVDIWKKGTDGVGAFKVTLKNPNNEWVGQFLADDPISIAIANVIFLKGYLDKGFPKSEDKASILEQTYQLIGRDYGQDLHNKLVDKSGKWMYKKQPADDIVDDMLSKANAEITFTSPHTAPQMAYTDAGSEHLSEAFSKIMEEIDYNFHVDVNKAFNMFLIGSVDSGITLKCVADAADNNILDLKRTEFDSYELRNYIIAKSGNIKDGWTDGNAVDFAKETNNVVTDEFIIVHDGPSSIKCSRGTASKCKLALWFPKYSYDELPFDLFGTETLTVWLYVIPTGELMPSVYIQLTDSNGKRIRRYWLASQDPSSFKKETWIQCTVPFGTEVRIRDYGSGKKLNWWVHQDSSNTFDWKITKLEFYAEMIFGGDGQVTSFIIDGLTLPFPMVSYRQDGPSQGLYKMRQVSTPAKNVRTQAELDVFAESELAKRKDPYGEITIIAKGLAGVIAGADKWIPGYKAKVNSPDDDINNEWYRMTGIHLIRSETPLFGNHTFIAEVKLVPASTPISGLRLSQIENPEIALLQELSAHIRFLEKVEEGKRDWWPPLPEPLSDELVKAGKFATLAETIVAWTRHWEAELAAVIDSEWTEVSDAAASKGKALKILSTDPNEKIITFFQIGDLGIGGELHLLVRLKVANNASANIVARIGIYDYAVGGWLAYRDIAANEFPASNKYHHFAVKVEVPQDRTQLSLFCIFKGNGVTDLWCDFAAFLPANVPLGYSDVTVLTEDPGSTGDLVDPGSTGDLVDPGTSAVNNARPSAVLLDIGFGSEVNVTTTQTTIREGTCSTTGDPSDEALLILKVRQGPSGGTGHVRIGVRVPGFVDFQYTFYVSDTLSYYNFPIYVPADCNGKTIKIMGRKDGGNIWLEGAIEVIQYKKHSHPISGDSHTTPISDDSHTTPISGDAHPHPDEEGGHPH